MKPFVCPLAIFFLTMIQSTIALAANEKLTLWYDSPAKKCMTEALPIGNGRLGAMIFGTTASERIVLNEDSLWTGGANPSGDYKDEFGAYQCLGEIHVELPGHEKAQSYRRDLDISTALSHVTYEMDGVKYTREAFASHPAGVIVVHLSADKPAGYTGSIQLIDKHEAKPTIDSPRITFAAALSNGLKYEMQLLVQNEGGSMRVDGEKITFDKCDSITMLLAAHTNYAMDFARHYRGDDPHDAVAREIESAAKTSYETLKAEHIADYQSLFDRVSLDLGESTDAQRAQPTHLRKVAAATTTDPELEALLFQFGRYLLISCSRPGGLPANLQGLWNDSNTPPWRSDYHSNINIQMNYWGAEVANLSECHSPFFDLIKSQIPAWREATAASPEFKTNNGEMTKRGFAIRTSHNIFGGMGWKWDKTANAWYCHHLWEHYAFTQDSTYLRDVALPIMQETVEFWQDHLKTLPDGRVVIPDAWSPEHGPTEDGVTYAQAIVWNLFTNYVEACDALKIDNKQREDVLALRDKLARPGIGSWGQLLEWMTEKHDPKLKELDTPQDHHRHTSHLFGVYPGRQISTAQTPDLAQAARISLEARGDTGDVREWSFAWRTALWARLGDGDRAHGQIMHLFADRNTCLNLFGLHPPMQIDGNLGITGAMAEMLIQSHTGEITLLPALPKAWPKGHVIGLVGRGGFWTDIEWKNGRLVAAKIRGIQGRNCRIRAGSRIRVTCEGSNVPVQWENKVSTFEIRPGNVYDIEPDP